MGGRYDDVCECVVSLPGVSFVLQLVSFQPLLTFAAVLCSGQTCFFHLYTVHKIHRLYSFLHVAALLLSVLLCLKGSLCLPQL